MVTKTFSVNENIGKKPEFQTKRILKQSHGAEKFERETLWAF